jgi:hypothetical protein
MILTTETLLSTTVYGTASGNYDGSSQDFLSDVNVRPITIKDKAAYKQCSYRLKDLWVAYACRPVSTMIL